ncbi:MAG: hypothetical protein H0X38_04810 [Planctomycetes bacterium]|nr:hypothetical protein [Planctomycetota bacterium]
MDHSPSPLPGSVTAGAPGSGHGAPQTRRPVRTVRGGSPQRGEDVAPPPSTRLPIAGSRSGRPSRWTTQPDPDSPLHRAAARHTVRQRVRVVVLALVLIAVLVVAIVTMTR